VDTVVNLTIPPPVTKTTNPVVDTLISKPVLAPPAAGAFAFSPNEPYYVVLVLNKVDPVFSNEARNAFSRHNRETYYNKQFTIELSELDADNKLMLMSPFKDAAEATTYVEKTRPKTSNEIIPWLKGGKYYYIIITDRNLQLLRANKNLEGYRSFLNQNIPDKF
jgi:REP element-mobilizing transposase RayT